MTESITLELTLLLGIGLFLVVLFALLRALSSFVPMSRERREGLARAIPVVGAVVGLMYALYVARVVFSPYETFVPIALLLIFVAFGATWWTGLRDIVAGVMLKAGGTAAVGDRVVVDGVRGRVTAMGLRVMTLEAEHGEEAVIPYGRIARTSLLRTPVVDFAAPHIFRVHAPTGAAMLESKIRVREAAAASHWSSIAREPEVHMVDDTTLEITVYLLNADRGPTVEAQVRASLAALKRDDPGP